MSMTGRSAPAPPAGWLPDPSRPEFDRYWDGASWTPRVRHRESGVEWSPAGASSVRRRSRRSVVAWAATAVVFAGVVAAAGWMGALPSWMPWPESLEKPAPTGPDVAYPVFGSDELVTYLARSMVAQEPTIDLSWMAFTDADAETTIPDAIYEAVNQNPYVFVEGWEWVIQYPDATLTPTYTYDDAEAERRRNETAVAVQLLAADGAVATAQGPRELATAVHDLVIASSSYDEAASDLVLDGASTGSSEVVARSQEAYGALVEGTAVCNGYAQAFLLLADAVGLDSVIVTGVADGGVTTGLHAWNLVRTGDDWLVVDTTWDDAGPFGTGDTYLLLPQGSSALDTRTADREWMSDGRIASYTG